jgi:uncharacterized protein with PhoU and TrkA domain
METSTSLTEIANQLATLKNTSELMIDLAYSAILFHSAILAEEVAMLEERMDTLHTAYELLVLSTITRPENARDVIGLLRLGVNTERIADAAARIADVVSRGLETHPVMQLVIEEAEETITRVTVAPTSLLVGRSLREAKIPFETGMWVLVIRREGQWIRPSPDTVIHAQDVVIASGYADGEEDFIHLATASS